MEYSSRQDLLRRLPTLEELLGSETAIGWLSEYPRSLVAACLREAVGEIRISLQSDTAGNTAVAHTSAEYLLGKAATLLADRIHPRLRGAINATGIVLHPLLGRAVWSAEVTDALADELKGYVTLGIDRDSGLPQPADQRLEYILRELTGAEAAIVVNSAAGGVLLALAALSGGKETVVSRGHLMEIGGRLRLPDLVALSGATMVEVGTTNCTRADDYTAAVTDNTAVLLKVHAGEFRIVGRTEQASLADMVQLARSKWLSTIDVLSSGALIDTEQFNLPHERTVAESIATGADLVVFSTDEFVGAASAGVIVGRGELIEQLRRHPLAGALEASKTSLIALERTLYLFRDADQLRRRHPLYAMLSVSTEKLQKRALDLASAIHDAAPSAETEVTPSLSYLTGELLPIETLATFAVSLRADGITPEQLSRRLRMDNACIFTRVAAGGVVMDVRTIFDEQIPIIARAVAAAINQSAQPDTQQRQNAGTQIAQNTRV